MTEIEAMAEAIAYAKTEWGREAGVVQRNGKPDVEKLPGRRRIVERWEVVIDCGDGGPFYQLVEVEVWDDGAVRCGYVGAVDRARVCYDAVKVRLGNLDSS